MATILTIPIPAATRRNPVALAAKMRHGGAMKHRSAGRRGQRNQQRDLLDAAAEEAICYICGKALPPGVGFVCSKKCSDEADAWMDEQEPEAGSKFCRDFHSRYPNELCPACGGATNP